MNKPAIRIAACAVSLCALVTGAVFAGSAADASSAPGSIIKATGVAPGKVVSTASAGAYGRLHLEPADVYSTLDSSNWSGYVTPEDSGTYTDTSAGFTVPAVTCSTATTAVAIWGGIDGWGDSTVEQDGVEANCTDGAPEYYAWIETYPAPEDVITTSADVPALVEPGDQIDVIVVEITPSEYQFGVTDVTQDWHVSVDADMPSGYTGQDLTSEVIAEAPFNGSTDQQYTLADFGDVAFTGAAYNATGYQDSNVLPVTMVVNGAQTDTVGAVSSGDFTVTYGAPAPAPTPTPTVQPKPAVPGGENEETALSIGWNAVAGATQYQVVVYGPDSSNLFRSTATSQTRVTFTAVPSGRYTYKVRAVNSAGASAWSASRKITFTR